MKLVYHKGRNFGDMLNPLIFNYYLGNKLEQESDTILLGIGSILGLVDFKDANKIIVFSSGFGAGMEETYGKLPKVDSRFHFLCVRGPLTARMLSLSNDVLQCDGAYLLLKLPSIQKYLNLEKKYDFVFIPHVGSLSFYNYEEMCIKAGIKYIAPDSSLEEIFLVIGQSKNVLAEAMHGAIVADAFRVNWCPVIFYKTINEFKWLDWSQSMHISEIKFVRLRGIFNKDFIVSSIRRKLRLSKAIASCITFFYYRIGQIRRRKEISNFFRNATKHQYYLSNDEILNHKVESLDKIIKSIM